MRETGSLQKSFGPPTEKACLRIWKSGVRISSGAPLAPRSCKIFADTSIMFKENCVALPPDLPNEQLPRAMAALIVLSIWLPLFSSAHPTSFQHPPLSACHALSHELLSSYTSDV